MNTGSFTIKEYMDILGSKNPIPGGGGVAAVTGCLGASLGMMVINLSKGKSKYAQYDSEYDMLLEDLTGLMQYFIKAADEDAESFEPLACAYSLPSDTPEEKAYKDEVMEDCLVQAATAPFDLMKLIGRSIEILERLGEIGSNMAKSDVAVGASNMVAALKSAAVNIYVNTGLMKNKNFAEQLNKETDSYLEKMLPRAEKVYEKILNELK